ncbi:unnamed protein product [Moneuplotes crassus]|uniref:Uncharacterized protein n=1 Tax=Euplotes crassus TaxID=5936 RepID=A0AAD1Y6G5_EUPCR|nr:unnamed protein product [Moneuplotes crassus]
MSETRRPDMDKEEKDHLQKMFKSLKNQPEIEWVDIRIVWKEIFLNSKCKKSSKLYKNLLKYFNLGEEYQKCESHFIKKTLISKMHTVEQKILKNTSICHKNRNRNKLKRRLQKLRKSRNMSISLHASLPAPLRYSTIYDSKCSLP